MSDSGLRIGFDYWFAATHAPGIGRYLRELVRALAALEQGPRLALLDVGPEGESIPEAALGLGAAGATVTHRKLRVRRGFLRWSERLSPLRAEAWLGDLDVFHRARATGAPSARAPQVVAVAEAPRSQAELLALKHMAAVIVFSETARLELLRQRAADEARIHVLDVGCDHWAREWTDVAEARGRPRILVLGSVVATGPQLDVLQAFERARGRGFDCDLVICGRRGDGAARLELALRGSPFRTDVRWIDEPVESAMPALLHSASVLVHLARDAWTPVTALEAFSLGVAVVVHRTEVFESALGDLAHYVDSEGTVLDVSALDRAIDGALIQGRGFTHSARRRERASRLTWAANARATVAVYETARAARSER